jgi:DNA-binding XRE family transcriptional regulator
VGTGNEVGNLSERLKRLREERFGPRGRAAIARLAGVTGTTWAAYEEENVVPSAEVIARLCSALPDLNPVWILSGQGEPFVSAGEAPSGLADLTNVSTEVIVKELSRRVRLHVDAATEMLDLARKMQQQIDQLESQESPKEP